MKSGVELLDDAPGDGEVVRRQARYRFRLRIWLRRGDPVRWALPFGSWDTAELSDDGATLTTDLRVDRENLFPGLFYAVQGMRVGGTRTVRIAPHLGYGERGIPGTVPPDALLTVEVAVLAALQAAPR